MIMLSVGVQLILISEMLHITVPCLITMQNNYIVFIINILKLMTLKSAILPLKIMLSSTLEGHSLHLVEVEQAVIA